MIMRQGCNLHDTSVLRLHSTSWPLFIEEETVDTNFMERKDTLASCTRTIHGMACTLLAGQSCSTSESVWLVLICIYK
jgi:hypothetical protein